MRYPPFPSNQSPLFLRIHLEVIRVHLIPVINGRRRVLHVLIHELKLLLGEHLDELGVHLLLPLLHVVDLLLNGFLPASLKLLELSLPLKHVLVLLIEVIISMGSGASILGSCPHRRGAAWGHHDILFHVHYDGALRFGVLFRQGCEASFGVLHKGR